MAASFEFAKSKKFLKNVILHPTLKNMLCVTITNFTISHTVINIHSSIFSLPAGSKSLVFTPIFFMN